VLIGKERIASIGRNIDRKEDGAHGRLRHHRCVGMPILPHDAFVAGLAGNLQDLGIGLHSFVVGMNEYLPKATREGLVTLGIKRLIAKKDDAMLKQRRAYGGDRLGVEVLAHIDVVDLGANIAGDGANLDLAIAHMSSSLACQCPAVCEQLEPSFSCDALPGGTGSRDTRATSYWST